MMSSIELITKEREEQITKHGRTIQDDVKYNNEYQLVEAASTLSMNVPNEIFDSYLGYHEHYPPTGWKSDLWGKMLRKPYKERLVIAAALLAAEIDRIEANEIADKIVEILQPVKADASIVW